MKQYISIHFSHPIAWLWRVLILFSLTALLFGCGFRNDVYPPDTPTGQGGGMPDPNSFRMTPTTEHPGAIQDKYIPAEKMTNK